jgi:saccharopine dehydrogenase (NAD+, L-lysine forming)
MNKIKIGILREGKVPPDKRVPLLPDQCRQVLNQYSHVSIVIQPSDIRCIANQEYADMNIPMQEDLSDCDILIGVKEVPVYLLIPDKTYLFFTHTIKKQPHNQKLLQTALERKITLIDYECLTDVSGVRVIAFGRFAGIVGTYNGLMMYGKKSSLFDLKRAYQCFDYNEMKKELGKVKLPNVKIILTGAGRVGNGAAEILNFLNIKKVSLEDYLSKEFGEPVYTQLSSKDYHRKKNGSPWSNEEFYAHPERFESTFQKTLSVTDILIAGAYWDPNAPMLFKKEDIEKDFRIKIIADITCDIGGSIPTTIKASTIYDPCYDYNPRTHALEAPFSNPENITVMSVDNLPGELPRDASRDFGQQLMQNVFPSLLNNDSTGIICRGTICKEGKLCPDFEYLRDYAESI